MIEIKDLYKSYGDKAVLKGFSALFKDGGRYALMGKSGIGKTTLFRLILGLEQQDGGSMEFSGRTEPSFSVVFQEDRLFEKCDAITNICAATKGLSKNEAKEALRYIASDIDERIPCRSLSGGQKRRVAVIRALLHPSDIVIMDEPFSGLDKEARRLTAEFIDKRLQGRTLLISTHDREEAELLSCELMFLS